MKGDLHVRFCERLGLKCPCLLDLSIYLKPMRCIGKKENETALRGGGVKQDLEPGVPSVSPFRDPAA